MIKTFLQVAPESHFSIHNLPFGVCSFPSLNQTERACSRIGDHAVDLLAISENSLWTNPPIDYTAVFSKPYLNDFMALGKEHWRYIRLQLQSLLSSGSKLSTDEELKKRILIPISQAVNHLPVRIGDYTDFYASKEHATNVGTMFRGKENALNPNWLHVPIGYHGRASSIVVSGTQVKRPWGQIKGPNDELPYLSPSKKLDFELEMAFVVGTGNKLGDSIPVDKAKDHIFGVVLMNDWSARDIQAWEYVPLGPFLGKSFATTISPWIVTLDALDPFRVPGPIQDPKPLDYLQEQPANSSYNVQLEVSIAPKGGKGKLVCTSNLKYLYWSFIQQLAHHTINGCNMQPGDLCGTGTISGSTKESLGSMLELSWNGKEPIQLDDNVSRTFLEDGDTVTMVAYCQGEGYRVGFGECIGQLTAADPSK